MFIAALEYRKFVQRTRTADERNKKLTALALREKSVNESELSEKQIIQGILNDYRNGVDILDPDLFSASDIEEFATQNRITKDPMVIRFIELAR